MTTNNFAKKIIQSHDMLNEKGFQNADLLPSRLTVKPNYIFSSSYVSALQSIYPLCYQNNNKIYVDYALSPIKHENTILPINCLYKHFSYLIDYIYENYKSSIISNNISNIEFPIDIKNRLFPFLFKLINKFKNTESVVLISTHPCICKCILKYFNVKFDNDFNNGNWISIKVSNSTVDHIKC